MGLTKYRARIVNNWVRLLLSSGEPNVTEFADSWADGHTVEIEAVEPDSALLALSLCYPREVGFKVISMQTIGDDTLLRDWTPPLEASPN
ncbi:hypothetical protein [Polymorphum gilvum]|uniref:hypothetical protein n=1 Tax=Polymorphum gilvum TaxID=991904 RepID=UPI0011D1C656|nr:hypothetical protein [Polymorphum gilvum]